MSVTVQDLLSEALMDSKSDNNEMIEILEFLRDNGVPLTQDQAIAMFMLKEADIDDVSNFVMNVRKMMTPTKKYYDMTDKLTLANRIKGNAKLGNLLKANANPANGSLNFDKALAKDVR